MSLFDSLIVMTASDTGRVKLAFYTSPCASGSNPLHYGWAVWGGGTHSPPPVLQPGAGKQVSKTCPLPSPDSRCTCNPPVACDVRASLT